MLRATASCLVSLLALCLTGPAMAQDQVRIYRCTDASGALLIQNDQPCPAGHQQEVQVIDVPPTLPAYVPRAERMPEVVAAEQAVVASAILEALPAPVPVGERIAPPAYTRDRLDSGLLADLDGVVAGETGGGSAPSTIRDARTGQTLRA